MYCKNTKPYIAELKDLLYKESNTDWKGQSDKKIFTGSLPTTKSEVAPFSLASIDFLVRRKKDKLLSILNSQRRN